MFKAIEQSASNMPDTNPVQNSGKLALRNIQAKLLDGYGPHQYGFRLQSFAVCANIALHDFMTKNLEENNVQVYKILLMTLTDRSLKSSLSDLLNAKCLLRIFGG